MDKFTTLTGVAAPLPLINIDTDMIIPKQFLKTIKRTGLGANLFDEMRFTKDGAEIPDFVLNQSAYRRARIIVAGANFGCGSSREHAPWALADFGINCVIAPSFADIFYNNSFKNGILPIVLPQEQVDLLMEDAKKGANAVLTVDLAKPDHLPPRRPENFLRHRPLPQALPSERVGRHRPYFAEAEQDRQLRVEPEAGAALALIF